MDLNMSKMNGDEATMIVLYIYLDKKYDFIIRFLKFYYYKSFI